MRSSSRPVVSGRDTPLPRADRAIVAWEYVRGTARAYCSARRTSSNVDRTAPCKHSPATRPMLHYGVVRVHKTTAGSSRFGVFELDLSAGELRKKRRQTAPARPAVPGAGLLLDRAGEVVTREELQQKLWPSDTFVDFDHSLNTAINKVREALGDSASSPRYVETLARRGYRFIAPVLQTDESAIRSDPCPPVQLILAPQKLKRRTGSACSCAPSRTRSPHPSPRASPADSLR